ncbi:unnamed protein product [Alopecurus aequalis]
MEADPPPTPDHPSSPGGQDLPTVRTRIRTILGAVDAHHDKRVIVGGWVRTGRKSSSVLAFLELNDGSCQQNLQAVVKREKYELRRLTPTGTSVLLDGVLVALDGAKHKQLIELQVERVIDVGESDARTYPLPKTKHSLEGLRELPHLRARTDTIAAVARIRSELAFATYIFFRDRGFWQVRTPVISTSDCEGAGEMFQVTTLFSQAEKVEKELKVKAAPSEADIEADDGTISFENDFFRRQAFLTVSGQLQAETYASALGSVYTFGPTFRAENSHTSRHLAEFWMVEPEMAFANLRDDMDCAESYVQHLCKWVLEHCRGDMEFMVEHSRESTAIERLELVSATPFERITYTKAVEILENADKAFENKVEWGIDLGSEHERYLTDVVFKKPVIVYNYPKEIKAFYMRLNDDQKTVAAMDVLVPKVGELIGGSQREERLDILKQRIIDGGLDLGQYEWYLELRRFGSVKHSGFGMGFERMLLFATGLDNIRDVIPFPRSPGKADL